MQRVVYNGHKCVHALKFHAIAVPNGLIANLYGPVEGCRHDAGMLKDSGLLNSLQLTHIMLKGSCFACMETRLNHCARI